MSRNIQEQDSYDNQLGNLVKKCLWLAIDQLAFICIVTYCVPSLPLHIECTDSMFVCDKTLVYTNMFSWEKCCL